MGWTAIESVSVEVSVDALVAHGPVLLAAVRVITLDDDEAADIVQATFEIALHRLHTLRDPAALRAWLLRIATREAFRVVRRLRRSVSLDRSVVEIAVVGPIKTQLKSGLATLREVLRDA